jgi:hypothetical protein
VIAVFMGEQATAATFPEPSPGEGTRAISPRRAIDGKARAAGGKLSGMAESDEKADLLRYLQIARESLVWKLDGLSEYDVRRPLVPTGTNLLGLVKHCGSVELGYFGHSFGRPPAESQPWLDDDADLDDDMWAKPEESRDDIIDFYKRAWAHADETINANPLDAIGSVPWWPADRRESTLHRLLVHVIAETNRHAGHADILRELIDGAAGLRVDNSNLASTDPAYWDRHRDRIEQAARQAAGP